MFLKGFCEIFALKNHIIFKEDRIIANLAVKLENSFLKRKQIVKIYIVSMPSFALHCFCIANETKSK